eukprot:UN27379
MPSVIRSQRKVFTTREQNACYATSPKGCFPKTFRIETPRHLHVQQSCPSKGTCPTNGCQSAGWR